MTGILCTSLTHFSHKRMSRSLKVPQLPVRGAFGNLDENQNVSQVKFQFQLNKVYPIEIRFTPGSVFSSHQIAIFVNRRKLGCVDKATEEWGGEQRKQIPQKWLRKGINSLMFVSVNSKIKPEQWRVRNVYFLRSQFRILPVEISPKLLLEHATALFDQRNTRLGNLWKAKIEAESVAEFYSQNGFQEPSLISAFQRKVEEELDLLVSRKIPEISAQFILGDFRSAKRHVLELFSEIPDPRDLRRKEIEAIWKGLLLR